MKRLFLIFTLINCLIAINADNLTLLVIFHKEVFLTQYSDSTKEILTYDKVGRIIKEESLHSKTEYK